MKFDRRTAYGGYAFLAIFAVTILSLAFRALLIETNIATTSIARVTIPGVASVPREQATRTITLDGRILRVTVADTPAAQEQGLGGRASLAPDEGMLFVFREDGTYGFWMKDMKFAIDIVWLSADGTVISVNKNVSPDTFPAVFIPPVPVKYVLELPARYSEVYTIRPGSKATL